MEVGLLSKAILCTIFHPGKWTMAYTGEYIDYPKDQDVDVLWKVSRWLSLFRSVIGGGGAMF